MNILNVLAFVLLWLQMATYLIANKVRRERSLGIDEIVNSFLMREPLCTVALINKMYQLAYEGSTFMKTPGGSFCDSFQYVYTLIIDCLVSHGQLINICAGFQHRQLL